MLEYLTTNYPELAEQFVSKLSPKSEKVEAQEEVPDEDFSETDDDGEDDYFNEEAEKIFNNKRERHGSSRRQSVSAAVLKLDQETEAIDFQTHEKTEEEADIIKEYIQKIFLCSSLSAVDKDKIIKAFEKTEVDEGLEIITQGDTKAEHYYIVGTGTADVIKDGEKVLEYGKGDAFGELALMYNAPRAATVRASSPCTLWRLDQKVFKTILMANAMMDRSRRSEIVSNIPILKEMGEKEKQKVVEALKSTAVSQGEIICKQGDPGDEFFIISEGKVDVIVNDQEIGHLSAGEYFGEISLLTTKPRQATIRASSDKVVLLSVHRKVFQRVLGPLSDILKRNMTTYSEYVAGVRISA